jgi:hypothetical protein
MKLVGLVGKSIAGCIYYLNSEMKKMVNRIISNVTGWLVGWLIGWLVGG